MVITTQFPLSPRDLALLRAVASGRCELSAGCGPMLLVDGYWCCDQLAGHRLTGAGLITPPITERRTPARLTATGRAMLDAA